MRMTNKEWERLSTLSTNYKKPVKSKLTLLIYLGYINILISLFNLL